MAAIDEKDERRTHHIVFTAGELDLPPLRETPTTRALLGAGWCIARYEVVPIEDGYSVTVFFRRARLLK